MIQIRCTQKVIEQLRLKQEDLCDVKETSSLLGNWYTNLFILDRRKTLIFMSERTLLSFMIFGIRKANIKGLPIVFHNGLRQLLLIEELDNNVISNVVKDCREIEFTRTTSRSLIGNLNDLINLYKGLILTGGGLDSCDLDSIIKKINRTPQKNLGWANSAEIAREILSLKIA
jgi:hypothetical protein